MDDFNTDPSDDAGEAESQEAAGQPETAPAAPEVIEVTPEPSAYQAERRAEAIDLTEGGRPEMRKSLTQGGAVNRPLEGPASPFKPPTSPA